MMTINLDDMTMPEFEQKVKGNPLVILPIGSIEEHGEHLPLCTDSIQGEAMAQRIAKHFDGIVCPPVRYGNCSSTRNFPGTISISFDALRMLVREILQELCRHGVKRVLILSGHAGSAHLCAIREAGKDVVAQHSDLKLMALSDYEIAFDLAGSEFEANDGHAGAIETSRVLNIDKRLVRGKPAKQDGRPPRFMIVNNSQDYFKTGIMGNPSAASKESGARIDKYIFDKLTTLIEKSLM